jgi:hypothetical protein
MNGNNLRPDNTVKGMGFLGAIPRLDNPKDSSTELSIGIDWGTGEKLIPTMVPTLDDNELKYLLSTPADKLNSVNPDLNKSITRKAVEFAKQRESQGLPLFARPDESPKEPRKVTKSIFGYPIVEPDEGLLKWFKENPETTGMQWGVGKNESPTDTPRSIVLNPFSKLNEDQKMAVARNEAIRHFIDEKNIIPKFNLTPEQEKAFAGTQYGKVADKTPLKQSILARILTGDESVGTITPMQKRWADWLKTQLPKE